MADRLPVFKNLPLPEGANINQLGKPVRVDAILTGKHVVVYGVLESFGVTETGHFLFRFVGEKNSTTVASIDHVRIT